MPQESRNTGDRLTEYAARPTVYTPDLPPPPPPREPRRPARTLRATVGILLFLVGPPVLLWTVGGNPTHRLPAWSQVADWFEQSSGRFTPQLLTGIALWTLWLLWAALALLLTAEVLAVLTRWRIPLRLPAPMHRLVFGLAGTAAIAVTSVGRLDATVVGTAAPTTAVTSTSNSVPQQAVARGPATILVDDTTYVYTVERHDTLSKIAKQWLGDATRWPEICRLNKHRHLSGDRGILRDCDLIYPGWQLRLPSDATPPAAARPAPPARRSPEQQLRPSEPAPSTTTPDRNPHVSPGPSLTVVPTQQPDPTATAEPPPSTAEGDVTADENGIHLPGTTFIPWVLAAAIAAAVALVWRQRRRRYLPDTHAPDEDDLPTAVTQITQQTRRHPELAALDARTADAPGLPVLPPQPIGIVGDGAHAAARAALTATLASDGPADHGRRGTVIIDRPTLAALFGPRATDLPQPWDRLQVVADLTEALTAMEAQLLHRARIRDETSINHTDPPTTTDDQAPGPWLLVTLTPPAESRSRTRIVLNLGTDYGITALLLGEWPHGTTIAVNADAQARTTTGQPVEPFGEHTALLDHDTAIAVLHTLREAHTGEPPHHPADTPTPPDDAADTETHPADVPQQPPAATANTPGTARLRVLGTPRVNDVTLPGRPLRSKAAELAVYLACHPDGADTATIAEHLVPDARLRAARQQVHTNVSNLRHVLARAGGPRPGGYLLKGGANDRYRLDPTTVDVDLWRLRDLLRRATLASGPARVDMLREACALYTAPLADGCDYEWVDAHREKARRWAVEAHVLLANELLDTDPQAASDLLDRAIGVDCYNEELYRRAMQARHARGDHEGIPALLRGLTVALADLDAQPSDVTLRLARSLTTGQPHS